MCWVSGYKTPCFQVANRGHVSSTLAPCPGRCVGSVVVSGVIRALVACRPPCSAWVAWEERALLVCSGEVFGDVSSCRHVLASRRRTKQRVGKSQNVLRTDEPPTPRGLRHTPRPLWGFAVCVLLASLAWSACCPLPRGRLCSATSMWACPLCHSSRNKLCS